MLESVLADVLTRVLGQYLQGIDTDSVRFGAWSGLVELRGVALRPEALAVLFETLGMDLPVTVEAGFIGLLSLKVPWNAIGSTPVRIVMQDITIMARPVRGDGSDDSELKLRERRIKRAKLNTDDAVREASWGVASDDDDTTTSSRWSSWLVSDQLRAKIIDNIQIHLKDIHLCFEDPFSDNNRPYVASIICESLEAVSANQNWKEAFVENSAGSKTRKLISLKGFRINWAPLNPKGSPTLSSTKNQQVDNNHNRFQTPELLKRFIKSDVLTDTQSKSITSAKSLLSPVDGVMQLQLSGSEQPTYSKHDLHSQTPHVDLHIQFPNLEIDLDDVQYASLLQTSVYFARLSTRGFRPKQPKHRWIWAVDQLLPGFSSRRKRILRFTEEGVKETRERRLLYVAIRKSLLHARRSEIEEPAITTKELEEIEDKISFEEIIAYRDWTDAIIRTEEKKRHAAQQSSKQSQPSSSQGTTSSAMWRMLGYTESNTSQTESENVLPQDTGQHHNLTTNVETLPDSEGENSHPPLALRVAFSLGEATLRIAEKGYPDIARPRVAFNLQNFRLGVLYSSAKDLVVEALLEKVEAWDLIKNHRMVYMRQSSSSSGDSIDTLDFSINAYPSDVTGIIESIRSVNPASRLLNQQPYSDSDSDNLIYEGEGAEELEENYKSESSPSMRESHSSRRHRSNSDSSSREPTPPVTYRVTETEFLGNPKDVPGSQKYIAAFQYTLKKGCANEFSVDSFSELDVSVAALEAIVDGPKGSFVWGLKFWKPKGMAQDPIMAFLGAAAGVRIAELRMELEEALVINKVPMKINAFILAPRFILSGERETMPSVVVNMGTLGVCTSDHSVEEPPNELIASQGGRVRYSNYVLTLDDLGIYYSPSLLSSVSQSLSSLKTDSPDLTTTLLTNHSVDTTGVERIIQPFCLQFVLQTLRDATVVQVAQSSGNTSTDAEARIAKIRLRGKIPELSLILTKTAFQHLISTGKNWAQQLQIETSNVHIDHHDPSVSESIRYTPTKTSVYHDKTFHGKTYETPPTTLASYNVRIVMDKVSLDLREDFDSRLITSVASQMCASVVKTGRVGLHANFSLGAWSITDKSRGNTAAFRRLLHAGVFPGTTGVSPPHSQAGSGEDQILLQDEDSRFVNIKYYLDFNTMEQNIRLRFLALNMICVRETYMKLAGFFQKVFKQVKLNRNSLTFSRETPIEPNIQDSADQHSPVTKGVPQRSSRSKITVLSEFDGFNVQLVASGGAIAIVEMKDSQIHFSRDGITPIRLWGGFGFFSIRDFTAPISKHTPVVTYDKPDVVLEQMAASNNKFETDDLNEKDEWSLSFPTSTFDQWMFRARFRGIKILFLYRFLNVIQQYFSELTTKLQPIISTFNNNTQETVESGGNASDIVYQNSTTNGIIDVILSDLDVRLPRHSSCGTEAIIVNVPKVIFNNSSRDDDVAWTIQFSSLQLSVEYLARKHQSSQELTSFQSAFLDNFSMCITRSLVRQSVDNNLQEPSFSTNVTVSDPMCINLSEAQYTVLYFVATENFAETIQGTEVAMASNDFVFMEKTDCVDESVRDVGPGEQEVPLKQSETSRSDDLDAIGEHEPPTNRNPITLKLPGVNIEISRGWDVTQDNCKVLGVYLSDVIAKFSAIPGKYLWSELNANISSIQDLRYKQQIQLRTIAGQLITPTDSNENETSSSQSLLFTYEKQIPQRPRITALLSGVHLELPPDLLRDLTFLAVPGWPFLESSAFAPDYVYVGRLINVAITGSQVIIRSKEHVEDQRALALLGEFQLRMEWMRITGAKKIALRSTQVEIYSLSHVSESLVVNDTQGITNVLIQPFERSRIPLFYPADSYIEYVAAEVDENGCRLNISADAMLSVVDTTELSLLNSIAKRATQMEGSYLSERSWVQPMSPTAEADDAGAVEAKEERKKKAKENMSVSITVPVARYLVTDSQDEHTVPILEMRLMSFTAQAHVGNMAQVDGQISVDLFNSQKGWWEPALEPWHINASMSNGQSGSRAFVIKSDQRLNINIAPASVTAARKVGKAIKNVTSFQKAEKAISTSSRQNRIHTKAGKDSSNRVPSVAAFIVRNQMGIPISISVEGKSDWIRLALDAEVEVGAETENLLTSAKSNATNKREKILKCTISVPQYIPIDVSASDLGKQILVLHRSAESDGTSAANNQDQFPAKELPVIWEVEMNNGVPLCNVRSLYRIINETQTTLQISSMNIMNDHTLTSSTFGSGLQVIRPSESFAIPIERSNQQMVVRPDILRNGTDSSRDVVRFPAFDWSTPVPKTDFLYDVARHYKINNSNRGFERYPSQGINLSCRGLNGTGLDFAVEVIALSGTSFGHSGTTYRWLDILLRAPIILKNNLPRPLSYRFLHRDFQMVPGTIESSTSLVVLAAGSIKSQERANIHIPSENLNTCSLSLAYDNQAVETQSLSVNAKVDKEIPNVFGEAVRLDQLVEQTMRAIYPSPSETRDSNGQPRRHFRATIRPTIRGTPHFDIFAGIWIRNRSDTALEVCSRTSFYAPGSLLFRLREKPPFEEPDSYVCCEGPYISIRLPSSSNPVASEETIDRSSWWTTSLEDIKKSCKVLLRGKNLEIEARPVPASEPQSYIVTIRNSSWIVNGTPTYIQWCRNGALDSHGNCRSKDVNVLPPGRAQGMHWESKSSSKDIHLRICNSSGTSEWIWSPPIPLHAGHSRELPAKMYRPRTQEQYIARVKASKIAGNSDALVIYGEDRENPPYRIVNLCHERAIAFSQIGTNERPWLLRGGKSTRYAWDDPLAPQANRRLSVRILEPEDLLGRKSQERTTSSESRTGGMSHPLFDLNIDIVNERSMVLTQFYNPSVVISVTVDGATKIVTFSEESNDTPPGSSQTRTINNMETDHSISSPEVPTVSWEQVGHKDTYTESKTIIVFDYPQKEAQDLEKGLIVEEKNMDVAVFLNSIGISVIDDEPCELFYACAQDIFLNYESYKGLKGIGLSIKHFQVDNQLLRTPYPVFFWMGARPLKHNLQRNGTNTDEEKNALEIRCNVRNGEILMIDHLYISTNHCFLFLEDKIISKTLSFISETAIFGRDNIMESLSGADEDHQSFVRFLPNKRNEMNLMESKIETNIPSSKRIYVHDLRIDGTTLRLTSSGTGGALAKAAGINASARALFTLAVNVENCDFQFQTLGLKHVFDTTHHFMKLVREYYIYQFSGQKMKLLASNSLMGKPAALFDAVSIGAKDFFSEPGKATKSSEFIAKFGKGSKSLFTNTVGGIVESVSSVPRAVSSGIERVVGDKDYLAERERIRGSNLAGGSRLSASSSSSRNGFTTGATSFAHGISSGVTGLFREPVQGAKQGGASGLLKGIGKAVIGGVAKPMAGAMDLVAEPASGLARQIAHLDETYNNIGAIRPPRTFYGRNQRLQIYDMKFSFGICLYRTIQHLCGLRYEWKLLDWIELSGRNDRKDFNSVEWAWNILKYYSRNVPGAMKSNNYHLRDEKTRIALITENDILIVTLDCKLVDCITLWHDAKYIIETNGMQLLLTTKIESNRNNRNVFNGFDYGFLSAPWDESNIVRRRRPLIGQDVKNTINCGSNEACEDLKESLKLIINRFEEEELSGIRDDMEMESISEWNKTNDIPLETTILRRRRSKTTATTTTSNLLSNNGMDEKKYELNRKIEELKRKSKRLTHSKHSLRLIIINGLSFDMDLIIEQAYLKSGRWRSEINEQIASMNAILIEADISGIEKNEEICGMLLYKIVKRNESHIKEIGKVEIEILSGKNETNSFATNISDGYSIKYDTCEIEGTIIFNITQDETQTRLESKQDTKLLDSTAMSQDEKLLQQLLDIGFEMEAAVCALSDAKGDIVQAVDILTRK